MDGNEGEEGVNLEMPSRQTTAVDILAEILQIVCFAAVKMTTSGNKFHRLFYIFDRDLHGKQLALGHIRFY